MQVVGAALDLDTIINLHIDLPQWLLLGQAQKPWLRTCTMFQLEEGKTGRRFSSALSSHTGLQTHTLYHQPVWLNRTLSTKENSYIRKKGCLEYIILEGHVQHPNKGTRYLENGWQKQGQRQWKAIVPTKWKMLVPQSSLSWSCNIWQGVHFTGLTLSLRIFSPDLSFLENRKILLRFPNQSLLTPIPCSDKLPTTLWNMTHKAQCHYKLRAMADLWIQLPPCL